MLFQKLFIQSLCEQVETVNPLLSSTSEKKRSFLFFYNISCFDFMLKWPVIYKNIAHLRKMANYIILKGIN